MYVSFSVMVIWRSKEVTFSFFVLIFYFLNNYDEIVAYAISFSEYEHKCAHITVNSTHIREMPHIMIQ